MFFFRVDFPSPRNLHSGGYCTVQHCGGWRCVPSGVLGLCKQQRVLYLPIQTDPNAATSIHSQAASNQDPVTSNEPGTHLTLRSGCSCSAKLLLFLSVAVQRDFTQCSAETFFQLWPWCACQATLLRECCYELVGSSLCSCPQKMFPDMKDSWLRGCDLSPDREVPNSISQMFYC